MDERLPVTTSPRLLTTVLIFTVLLLHSLGYYMSRGMLHALLLDTLQLPEADVRDLMQGGMFTRPLGALAGGVTAAFVGPVPALAIGLLGSATGQGGLCASSGATTAGAALMLVSAAQGFFRPALYVALARQFGRDAESARTAALLLVSLAADIGGFLGPLAGGSLDASMRESVPWIGAAGACGLSLAAAAVTGALLGVASPGMARPGRVDVRTLTVAGATVAVAFFYWPLFSFGSAFHMEAVFAMDMAGPLPFSWLLAADGLGSWLVTLIVGLGLLAAQSARLHLPALAVAGVGALLCGASLIPVVGLGPDDYGPMASLLALQGAGSALVWAGLMSRAVGELNVRVAVLFAALLLAASSTSGAVLGEAPGLLGVSAAGFAAAGAGGLLSAIGLGMFLAAWPAQRWLGTSEAETPAPPPKGGPDPYGFDQR